MRRSWLLSAIAASLLNLAPAARAGRDSPLAAGLSQAEREGLQAIAELPPGLLEAALVAARRPELLVRVPAWRSEFEVRLGGLLFGLEAAAAARLERLAAHPDLVAALLSRQGPALEQALDAYPAELQQSARDAVRFQQPQLRELLALQERAAARAEAALAELAAEERAAFARVLDEPGLSALLLDQLRAAQLLAAAHALDAAGTASELARIRAELARARQLEAEERAARERAAAEAALRKAERDAERRRWRRWRRDWGYDRFHHPYDVYYGRWCDPWAWGWHRRWRNCW